jgi:hypothetical protein
MLALAPGRNLQPQLNAVLFLTASSLVEYTSLGLRITHCSIEGGLNGRGLLFKPGLNLPWQLRVLQPGTVSSTAYLGFGYLQALLATNIIDLGPQQSCLEFLDRLNVQGNLQ